MPRISKGTKYALLLSGKAGKWHYVVRTANHKVLTDSETFSDKPGAVRSAKRSVGKDNVYEHGTERGRRLVAVK